MRELSALWWPGEELSISESFLEEYIVRMGLARKQLFPKYEEKGDKGEAVSYQRMYQALEETKMRLGMDSTLIWYSWRIGAATRGNALGVRRTVVKGAGLWKSGAVDGYCHEEEPGMVLSETLANSWD